MQYSPYVSYHSYMGYITLAIRNVIKLMVVGIEVEVVTVNKNLSMRVVIFKTS